MGLFRDAGRTFEKLKQSYEAGTDAEYVCRSCEEPASEDFDACPRCGAEAIESTG